MDICNPTLFGRLIDEAEDEPFVGWDFSYIARRWRVEEPSWDYRQRVQEAIQGTHRLLDLGTGGGEILSSFNPLPSETYATEAYPPNVPLARARLEPLGVRVAAIEDDKQLPFEDGFFDTVINRHEKFIASEVARILVPEGWFITQQVGTYNLVAINEWLEDEVEKRPSSYPRARRYLEEAGLEIITHQEEFPETVFYDVGAVVYYLKAIPWQVPDFTVAKYYGRLAALHNHIQTYGVFSATSHRYYIEARRM